MNNESKTTFETAFENEVYQGLSDYPKHLSSKYFYDAIGDKLFQDIMNMPEYYLTDAEYDIFANQKEEIAQLFSKNGARFNLVELGAGDGLKTKVLLQHFTEKGLQYKYQPIDISQNVLDILENSITKELPKVNIETIQGTYFEALKKAAKNNNARKIILFLGSNVGNLLHGQAIDFMISVQELMTDDDLFFVGFDQKKNPQTILNAYNDEAGITAAFNKNVLTRINTELEGNFNIDDFLHWETYNPETGTAKSYLVSKKEQSVQINGLDLKINFKPWETIHTEISQKYDDRTVHWLAEQSGLEIIEEFIDSKNQYKNYVFKKKSI